MRMKVNQDKVLVSRVQINSKAESPFEAANMFETVLQMRAHSFVTQSSGAMSADSAYRLRSDNQFLHGRMSCTFETGAQGP